MVGALLAALVLTALIPHPTSPFMHYFIPGLGVALLVVLIAADPGKIDRRGTWPRLVSLSLVTVLILGALWATGGLIHQLVEGTGPVANDAETLLLTGAIVWASNNIAFSLLYWDLDSGGSAARLQYPPHYPDFAFPQQLNPELAPPGWRPLFADYLYLGFTNAMAFSPTDVMPFALWAKAAMTVQSLISLVIVGLVVARAVNAFT